MGWKQRNRGGDGEMKDGVETEKGVRRREEV